MRNVTASLVILFCLWVGAHVLPAEAARDKPPLACQLLGGTWSSWSGWDCY